MLVRGDYPLCIGVQLLEHASQSLVNKTPGHSLRGPQAPPPLLKLVYMLPFWDMRGITPQSSPLYNLISFGSNSHLPDH